MVFNGTTATTALSEENNIPSDIVSYTIANKTGGAITASVAIILGSSFTYILYNEPLTAGQTYVYSGKKIRMLPNYKIFVSVSGSSDYYFSII